MTQTNFLFFHFFRISKKLVESLNLTKNGNNEVYEYMAEKDTLKRLVLRLYNPIRLYFKKLWENFENLAKLKMSDLKKG